jgi:ferrous iron transport protein B
MKNDITIALAGNPNAGKTTVFNAMTGARQHIANYPGVTVEKKYGRAIHLNYEIEVVDLPGIYSLTAYSLEEVVARNFVLDEQPKLVVDIIDASNLDRNLYLAIQFQELGVPLIIGLNMMDLAESRGILVDHEKLSLLLGVPVIPMVARSNQGVQELLDKVVEMIEAPPQWQQPNISYGMDIDNGLNEIDAIINSSSILDKNYPSRWLALKCLEEDKQVLELLKKDPLVLEKSISISQRIARHTMGTLEEDPEGIITDHRYGYITAITKKAVKRQIESRLNMSDKIDKVMTNRILGPTLMIAILYGMYAFTFWASEAPMRWLSVFFSKLSAIVCALVPEGHLQSLIVSGIIDGVGGVLGFVPIIMFMFFAIAVMEDSGYMARTAFMLDRVLRWFGLHGNSVMSLIISGGISGGCAVPGIMATRTLRDPKERIATLLVVPFMNCGAKLPVYAVLIGAFFFEEQAGMMFLLTLLSWVFALFAAKLLRLTVLDGPQTPFVMELPPYRSPTLKGLFIHTWERTFQYIKKAGTIILMFSIILWAMMSFPGLSKEDTRLFEGQRIRLEEAFLAHPQAAKWLQSKPDLLRLNEYFDAYNQAVNAKNKAALEKLSANSFYLLAQTARALEKSPSGTKEIESGLSNAASEYIKYRNMLNSLKTEQQQATLKQTVAGWMGQRLEAITRPLGFDYRTNIALVAGFAAKEVVVSTLGTAYSLGETDQEEIGSLSKRLANDPAWSPLKAFTLIIFTMLYVPCIATVASIKKESSWKWAGFSIGFNLVAAYVVALLVSQAGQALGF